MKLTDSPAFAPVVGALIGATASGILAYATRELEQAPLDYWRGRDTGLVVLGTVFGGAMGMGLARAGSTTG